MSIFDGQQIAVAFCSPHRTIKLKNGAEVVEPIPFEWHKARMSLSVGTNCNFVEFFCNGHEIGDARDKVTRMALAHNPRPKYIFWLDDDVLPEWDAFVKLFYRGQTWPDYDIFAGVYACKGIGEPLVYAEEGCGPYWDWAIGDLLTSDSHNITGCHSGLTLVRTSLYQRMLDTGICSDEIPFYKTIKETGRAPNGAMQSRSGTEDLYFAQLARKVGAKFLVDTSVLAGHYDKVNGITWGLPEDSPPVKKAKWLGSRDRQELNGKSGVTEQILKLAIDLGAGGTRREWPGYKTYTLDIRPESKPDYCQDTRYLNLPNEHFDLVASSHHLEHLGRWEQERVWQEMARILKPGGVMEHIVPTIEWAASKLLEGPPDEHVYNVLYGAQEEHGYERQWNTHYFGYTKEIAKLLAESVGLVDIVVEDWRDKPELGYNLIIRGKKPEKVSELIESSMIEMKVG